MVERTEAAAQADRHRHADAGRDLDGEIRLGEIDQRFEQADSRDERRVRGRFEPWADRIQQAESAGQLPRGTAAEYRRRLERFIAQRRKIREAAHAKAVKRERGRQTTERIDVIQGREDDAVKRGDFADARRHAEERGGELLKAAREASGNGDFKRARELSEGYAAVGREIQGYHDKAKAAAVAEKAELIGHREELARIKAEALGLKDAADGLRIIEDADVVAARELRAELTAAAEALRRLGAGEIAVPDGKGLFPADRDPLTAPKPGRRGLPDARPWDGRLDPVAPRVAAPIPNPGKPGNIPQAGKGANGPSTTVTNTTTDNSVRVGRVVVNPDTKLGDLGKSKAAAIRMGRG
ncbi:hypothetical protein LzC2_41050 [Planctomycetes bacterium LzC2]|uniref:Uncharacterized protein n=1 Tax=Alienimonas chondri TaxID=2681879 RepID=A0ABX1VJT3_9PLAN|nr:hypothetical protein [Alienimonas chondri]